MSIDLALPDLDPTTLTPMMAQYLQIKNEHPGRLLFYRMGDFYEMFFDDAVLAAEKLHLTLTSRGQINGQPIPMAGVPVNHADSYLAKLLKFGISVAICEQLTEAGLKKGPIDRDVIRILTPGTLVEEHLLDAQKPQIIMAICPQKNAMGIATLDLTQGYLNLSSSRMNEWLHECARLNPAEIIGPENWALAESDLAFLAPYPITLRPQWEFDAFFSEKKIKQQFQLQSLDALDLKAVPGASEAAGALLNYAESMLKMPLSPLTKIRTQHASEFLYLDAHTRQNLELTQNLKGSESHTLGSILSPTKTAMGHRLLQQWMHHPLQDQKRINERLDAISALIAHEAFPVIQNMLESLGDVPRILTRVGLKTAKPQDLLTLEQVLFALPRLKKTLENLPQVFQNLIRDLGPFTEEMALLKKAIVPYPPSHWKEGGVFQTGYDPLLDTLRTKWGNSSDILQHMESQERQKTGIPTLKIHCNRIHGYFIEISLTQAAKNKIPSHYIRCQTLKNNERYKTPDLTAFENQILNAENQALQREKQLYLELLDHLNLSLVSLQKMGEALATLDVLSLLAERAHTLRWIRPQLTTTHKLEIIQGRHPVVEKELPDAFTPNDLFLTSEKQRIQLITGPNMGGKSTYMRQIALIVLLAHMGSFVPAQSATIGPIDRIFSRIGASDDLGSGRSTFMVEMTETAEILRHATSKSLVLIDEIGRGTSPLEGLAIAHAVLETLTASESGFILFSTHFFELTQWAQSQTALHNVHFDAIRQNGTLVFRHQLKEGPCSHSYGIEVADLAGLPTPVIGRALEHLKRLQKDQDSAAGT